jgi:hypothetical protein
MISGIPPEKAKQDLKNSLLIFGVVVASLRMLPYAIHYGRELTGLITSSS